MLQQMQDILRYPSPPTDEIDTHHMNTDAAGLAAVSSVLSSGLQSVMHPRVILPGEKQLEGAEAKGNGNGDEQHYQDDYYDDAYYTKEGSPYFDAISLHKTVTAVHFSHSIGTALSSTANNSASHTATGHNLIGSSTPGDPAQPLDTSTSSLLHTSTTPSTTLNFRFNELLSPAFTSTSNTLSLDSSTPLTVQTKPQTRSVHVPYQSARTSTPSTDSATNPIEPRTRGQRNPMSADTSPVPSSAEVAAIETAYLIAMDALSLFQDMQVGGKGLGTQVAPPSAAGPTQEHDGDAINTHTRRITLRQFSEVVYRAVLRNNAVRPPATVQTDQETALQRDPNNSSNSRLKYEDLSRGGAIVGLVQLLARDKRYVDFADFALIYREMILNYYDDSDKHCRQ